MAEPGFFNTNKHRAFPFLRGSVGAKIGGGMLALPSSAVVDCGFVMAQAAGFSPGEHSVFLRRVALQGAEVTFEFSTDAPLVGGGDLTFTRDAAGPEYVTEHADSEAQANVSQSADECEQPFWSGYLVTGPLDDLVALLGTSGGELVREGNDATVEPALVQSLAAGYVRMLALANDDRTRYTSPDGCEDVVWPYPITPLFEGPRCLQGEIYLTAGFNSVLRQDAADNALVLTGAPGAGAGQPCGELSLFPGESLPDSETLSGGPSCAEVVRSFNGIGGPLITITAGLGVSVLAVPSENKVVINANFAGMALCEGTSSISEVV